MGAQVAKPVPLELRVGRPIRSEPRTAAPPKASMNAHLGMVMWTLLWLGYNTDMARLMDPNFPHNAMDFIHGARALFPELAAWFACLLILTRSSRLFASLVDPVGLIIFYSLTGLISSATLSIKPSEALYFGANYLSIALVLLAIVMVEDPLQDLLRVLRLTWNVGTVLTLGLLGAIPFLGSRVIIPTEASPVGVRAYSGFGTVLGMESSRNTGFARYAAISGLAALAGVLRKGRLVNRVVYGVLLVVSVYALVLANGRTETAAFVVSLVVILATEKSRRFLFFLVGVGLAILLALRGFYSRFFLYLTRGGRLDTTLTGRTTIWTEGWHLILKSPWVGFGFQADRFYLNWHMHNAFLHAVAQAGFLGGVALFIGFGIVWYYTIYYFFMYQPSEKALIPPEIPAILLFTSISSLTESTFAYYSAAWLLSAPIVGYVMALHRRIRRSSRSPVQAQGGRALPSSRRSGRVSTSG
jgi:O-antigen ligase